MTKENCKQKIIDFLEEIVEIDVDEMEIYTSHRKGKPIKEKNQPMLVRCHPALKEWILQNAKNLKEKTNPEGDPYYISKQIPEEVAETNREIHETIRMQKNKDQYLLSDREGHGHKAVLYKSHFPATKALQYIHC